MIAYNKITKDRYLPTGPELAQSAQLFDISGDKMQLILDFGLVIGVGVLAAILRAYRRCLQLSLNGRPADRAATAVALALGLLMLFNGTYIDYRFGALWLGAALAGVRTGDTIGRTQE